MGIGNDIKPKKIYRYKPPHHSDEENKDREKKEEIEINQSDEKTPLPDHEEMEEMEDDFFHDYEKAQKDKQKPVEESGSFLFQGLNAKNITWLLLIALIAIVIYQNFDSIKKLVVKGDNNATLSKDDVYYEGESANKNTNTNSNQNSNTNVNANVNTNTNAVVNSNTSAVINSSVSLKVLNGNGISGSAEKVATTLKTAGFEPAKSGNASKYTYEDTYIYYKTGKEDAANAIKSALSGRSCILQNSDSIVGQYDVIIVVGKN